jgi:hypothetical protein
MTPIDEYLAELRAGLRLRPSYADRLLAEAEDHLRLAAEAAQADGLGPADAERTAVARFGGVDQVAWAANGGMVGALTRLVAWLARFGAVGALAVLAGAVASWALAGLSSRSWVFGLPDSAHPSDPRIAHWLAVQPNLGDWRTAAATENADDTLLLRGGAALLAVLACGIVAILLSRRFTPSAPRWLSLAAPAVFAVAAVALLIASGAGVTVGDWGRGQALCDATAALAVALVWVRRLRRRA